MVLLQTECPDDDIDKKKKKFSRITCQEAEMCLCTPRGKKVRAIRVALIDVLKRAYPVGSLRLPLYDGYVVLQLRRERGLVDTDLSCPGITIMFGTDPRSVVCSLQLIGLCRQWLCPVGRLNFGSGLSPCQSLGSAPKLSPAVDHWRRQTCFTCMSASTTVPRSARL